jgi:hypothetical protein
MVNLYKYKYNNRTGASEIMDDFGARRRRTKDALDKIAKINQLLVAIG